MAGNRVAEYRIGVGFDVDKTSLKGLNEALGVIQQQAQQATVTGKLTPELQKAQQEAKKLSAILNNAWSGKLQQFDLNKVNTGIKQTYSSVSQLKTKLEEIGPTGSIMYNQMASGLLGTNLQLKQSNRLLDEMATTLANSFKYTVAYGAINKVTQGLSSAFSYSQSLDTSLNDIRIVTGKSADEMERFAKNANTAAQDLGKSTLDYTKASLIYYQQGLSDEEVTARTETTLKAANVTGQSTQEVSEQLTAVWNGYKVSAEEAETYIDKLAAVAATTASDLEELSTGMSKVASAAASMGVDVDQLNAMLATIVSVTRQAPESVGTSLKTILARMGDLKLGGADEDGATLGKVSGMLDSLGIKILEVNGELRDMGSVVEEVGERWNSGEWSNAEKQAIAIELAGKRQYNALVALFDNWDMYNDAINTSINSVGTLQRQQDIYMESTAAHLQQLQTESQRLYDLLFDTKTINKTSDVLTTLLGSLNDFVEGIGGGTNAFIYFGSVVANVFTKQIASGINNTINKIGNLRKNVETLGVIKGLTQAGVSTPKDEMTQQAKTKLALQGIDTEGTNFKTQIPYMEKLLSLQKVMTIEEFNESQEIIKQIGQLSEKIALTEKIAEENKQNNKNAEDLSIILHNQLDTLKLYKQYNKDLVTAIDSHPDETTRGEIDSVVVSLDRHQAELQLTQEQINKLKEIKALKEDEKVGETDLQILQEILNQLIQKQNDLIKDTNSHYKAQVDVENHVVEQEQAKLDILKRQDDERTKELLKRQKIQTITRISTAAVQALSVSIGAIATGLDKSATGAEKLNSGFAAVSGTAGAIANMVMPGSGLIVQGILGIGQSILKATGQWEKWEFALSSTEDKIKKLNESMAKIADLSKTFVNSKNSIDDISEEFTTLVQKAGTYGENLDNLSKEQQARYHELVDIVTQYNESAILGYDEQGQKIVNNNTLIKETISLLKEQYELEAKKEFNDNYETNKETYNQQYRDTQQNIANAQENLIKGRQNYQAIKNSQNAESFTKALENLDLTSGLDTPIFKNFAKQIREAIDNNLDYREVSYVIDEFVTKNKELLPGLVQSKEQWLDTYKILTMTEDEYVTGLTDELNMAQKKLNDFKFSSSFLTNALKFLDDDKNNWEDLSTIAKEQGVDNIETFVANYIQGLTLSGDEISAAGNDEYEAALKKVRAFSQRLALAIQQGLTPDSLNKINPDDFDNYEDYVKAVFEYLDKLLEEGTLTQDNADIIAAFLGFDKITFDEEGFVKGYTDVLGKAKQDILKNLREKSGDETLNITDFSVEELQNSDTFLSFFNESLLKIGKVDEALKFAREDFQDFLNIAQRETNLAAVDSLISLLQKDTKLTKKDLKDIGELEYQIEGTEIELANIRDKNSKEYLKALREIQQQQEENAVIDAAKRVNTFKQRLEVYKKLMASEEEGSVEFKADFTEVEKDLKALLDADYEIYVSVQADIDSDFENFKNDLLELNNAASLIDKDFKVKADDIIKLSQAFPGILEGYKDLENGMIQLNKEVVQSTINGITEEVAADGQALADRLKNRKTELEAKLSTLEIALEESEKVTKGQLDNETALDKGIEILDKTLAETKADLSQDTSETLIDNSAEVAQAASDNAEKIDKAMNQAADNSLSYFNDLRNGAIDALADIADAAEKVANGEKVDRSKKGDTTIQRKIWVENLITDSTQANLKGSESIDTEINNTLDAKRKELELRQDTAKQEINLLKKQIGALDGYIAYADAKTDEVGKNLSNRVNGLGGPTKKSGSSSQPDKKDLLKEREELDIFHDIDLALADIAHQLKMVQKEEKKAFGLDYINNLNKQIKLLEKQKQLQKDKLKLAQQEAATRRAALAAEGVSFDASGYMTNYMNIMKAKLDHVNSLITAYNAMSAAEQKANKQTIEDAKKDYDDLKKQISEYDKLISNTIPQLEESLEDALNQQIELQIKAFNYEIDVRLDMAQARRDWNDFYKQVVLDIEGIADPVKKIITGAQASLADFRSYYEGRDGWGSIQYLTEHVGKVMKELDVLNGGGISDVYGDDRASAVADLKKYNDELMNGLKDAQKLTNDVKKSYLDGIDAAKEKLDKQKEQYEYIADILQHGINLTDLLGGEDSYDSLANYYSGLQDYNVKNLEFLRMEKEALQAQLNSVEKGSEAWKKLYEQYQNNIKDLNAALEESLKNVITKYENAINAAFDKYNRLLTGNVGLDYAQNSYDKQKDLAGDYLDQVNAQYAMSDLKSKFQKAINDTTNLDAQRKLNDLMEQELEKIRVINDEGERGNKISQYEVERAEKMLELELKKIALQEAQANKSQLRLRRDSQGNYTYQYIADQDAVNSAEDEVNKAANDLYNFDLNNYDKILSQATELTKKYEEEVSKILLDTHLGEVERNKLLEETYEWYYQKMTDLEDQLYWTKLNLGQSATQSLELSADELSDYFNQVVWDQIVPGWNGALDDMITHFSDYFYNDFENTMDAIKESTEEYKQDLADLEQAAGVDFSLIQDYINQTINATDDLIDRNEVLIESYEQEMEAIKQTIAEMERLIAAYEEATRKAIEMATQAQKAWEQVQLTMTNAANAARDAQQAMAAGTPEGVLSNVRPNTSGDTGGGTKQTTKVTALKVMYGAKFEWSGQTGSVFNSKSALNAYGEEINCYVGGEADRIEANGVMVIYYWFRKKYDQGGYAVKGFDTGGYTGDWGSKEGKIAMLHEKELVLNAEDTSNILSVVNIVRSMVGSVGAKVAAMAGTAGTGASFIPSATAANTEQQVTISASFPGVTSHSEIEQAFDNLINMASQHAFNTRP